MASLTLSLLFIFHLLITFIGSNSILNKGESTIPDKASEYLDAFEHCTTMIFTRKNLLFVLSPSPRLDQLFYLSTKDTSFLSTWELRRILCTNLLSTEDEILCSIVGQRLPSSQRKVVCSLIISLSSGNPALLGNTRRHNISFR